MSEQEHRITSEFKKWADDKDPLKLMTNKPVAKTPDVREELAKEIAGIKGMVTGEYIKPSEEEKEQSEYIYNKYIQPLIDQKVKEDWIKEPKSYGSYWMSPYIEGRYHHPHIIQIYDFSWGLGVDMKTSLSDHIDYYPNAKYCKVVYPNWQALTGGE